MQYDALAPMYDRLMFHVEYDEWIALIRRIASKFGVSPKPDILELGAGTGIIGSILQGMGYGYAASDISLPMCREARVKRGLPVCAADARYLPFKKQFGMALFLYDGINYLMTLDEYRRLFNAVHDVLLPGGLFLFDITTRANSLQHFAHYMDFEDYGDFSFVRNSWFDYGRSIQHNDFTIFRQVTDAPLKDAPGAAAAAAEARYYEKFVEEHSQKVFSVSEIERVIPKKRFKVLGIWDGYTFRKYTSKSIRIHFLLEKIY
ncbi:MAG: methyltransferase domain-containing protein [Chitinispirillia bacterium]|nr:methyltransferase domain-containing protein [Chitinispirillia bacterium]MCL2267916.1 methyltransferase domain-containing protein [Chitinispirillia bacterium]